MRLAAFVLLMAAVSAPAMASVQAGLDRWQAGNYDDAVQYWAAPAAKGDVEALFNLGQAYQLGKGVPQNRQTAVEYYRRAAEKGHAAATTNLGITLWQLGKKSESLLQLRKASELGDTRASYVLGVATFSGDGAPKNKSLGYAYVVRARDAGLDVASQQAGRMATLMTESERAMGLAAAKALQEGKPVAVAMAQPVAKPVETVTAAVSEDDAEREEVKTPPAKRAEKRWGAVKPQAVAEQAVEKAEGWKVQLGAYGNERAARSAWASLVSQSADLLQGNKPIYSPKANLVRLQVGPYTERQKASELCQRLSAAGRPCFITK